MPGFRTNASGAYFLVTSNVPALIEAQRLIAPRRLIQPIRHFACVSLMHDNYENAGRSRSENIVKLCSGVVISTPSESNPPPWSSIEV